MIIFDSSGILVLSGLIESVGVLEAVLVGVPEAVLVGVLEAVLVGVLEAVLVGVLVVFG